MTNEDGGGVLCTGTKGGARRALCLDDRERGLRKFQKMDTWSNCFNLKAFNLIVPR